MECTICCGCVSVQGVLDSCAHRFCLDCILKWAAIENSCPLCKQRFRRVTPKWKRKCLTEIGGIRKKAYRIEPRSQEVRAHTAMEYTAGEYRLRVVIPRSTGQSFMSVLEVFSELYREM